ncbi:MULTISPECIES: helix-turn-helix transcriptional regulator [Microbacterium]|uniref:helix-turn-helix domain-containing protein n=1 Tax=Microbacterium TaxID=33882 RepID=UPI000D64237A|nr:MULTISPECIES: helix-turn-helix transcriptional regulator [Microbacterium]
MMLRDPDEATGIAVGSFLRARRDAASPPETVGLRRVSGLRREEVAGLAGVSVSYYTRIEQGAVSATAEVLEAIARALQLSPDDREHLRDLTRAGRAGRDAEIGAPYELDDGLRRTLAALHAVPAAVLAFDMSILSWNRRAHEMFAPMVDFHAPASSARPNWAELLFTDPYCRSLFRPWEPVALDMVGRLRASLAKHPNEPVLRCTITRLRARSAEFEAVWRRYPVSITPLGVVRLDHPALGPLVLRDTVLRVGGASDQLLFIFHAVPQA